MLVALACPATNDRTPRYMEKALSAIHEGLESGERIVLSYRVIESQVSLAVRLHQSLAQRVIGPILANYPQAACVPVAAAEEARRTSGCARQLELTLTPHIFPILRHAQFEDLLNRQYADPIDSLLAALTPSGDIECRVDLTIAPAARWRVRRARRGLSLLDRQFLQARRKLAAWYVERIGTGRRRYTVALIEWLARRSAKSERAASLDVSASRTHEREADLLAAADKLSGHLFDVRLAIIATAPRSQAQEVDARLRTIAAAFGAFTRSRLAVFSPVKDGRRAEPFLLSNEELATLWHPPTAGVGTERLAVTAFTEREAPATLPAQLASGDTILGRTRFRSDDRTVILKDDDRRRHVYVVGKTGMGKTTLLLNQVHHDVTGGRGLCLIDPHGDLAEAVMGIVPAGRTNDVIVFDAGDTEHAVGFNPLACPDARRMDQVASGVVASLRKMYDSWGPRLEDTLRNAVYAAIEHRGTFLTVLRILSDASFREHIVSRLQDPIVRAFWQQEFAGWNKAYRTEAIAAIQNKIRPFLTNRTVRAIVGQADRSLDLRRIMDDAKILIVNLSKGRVGEDNAAMLGALLVSSIQEAAMRRADIPERDRRQFSLFVDEFQNFTTGSFATILSEARKYGLNLTISHQYFRQLDEQTADAVAGNVGTFVTFAVGSDDAEWLAGAMSKSPRQLSPHDLTNLPKYTACVRLLMDGLPSSPFTIRTQPSPEVDATRREVIRRQSRRQYARCTADVLDRVWKEMNVEA